MKGRSDPLVLSPRDGDLLKICHAPPLRPFSTEVIAFLDDLSEALTSDPSVRAMPDVYSFGFWCRRKSLETMKRNYHDLDRRIGRGVAFHIAPSNVPVNFAYSLAAGLLSGNANIVRVPTKEFSQVQTIGKWINCVIDSQAHQALCDHIRLVRYDRADHEITAKFSSACDVRVIWGGDTTINNIRHHQIPPHAFDITFADRYSSCVIDAEEYMNADTKPAIARDFYNDTYLFDQNACTAPHLIFWLGKKATADHAREIFWRELSEYAQGRYRLQTKSAIEKWGNALRYAACHPECRIQKSSNNIITRVEIQQPSAEIEHWRANCGFFFESQIESLDQILTAVSRRHQTLSYFGLDKAVLKELVIASRAAGIDRIVPVGRTLEFSMEWDGFNLVHILSRLVAIS